LNYSSLFDFNCFLLDLSSGAGKEAANTNFINAMATDLYIDIPLPLLSTPAFETGKVSGSSCGFLSNTDSYRETPSPWKHLI
jgi:hypothetical protein